MSMVEQQAPRTLPDWFQRNATPATGRRAIVLDVREPWEVQLASVPAANFELITMPMASVPARMAELPRDAAIACLCHHGGRSQQVAQFLSRQGFATLANVAGGIHAWASEVDPSIPRY